MKVKYDIGIQTFWNVPNYGTFAQAYALQKVLQELNPYKNIKQIAHLDQHHFNFYFNPKAYFHSYPIWKRTFWKSFFIKSSAVEKKERVFLNAYATIPHTDIIDASNIVNYRFDKVFLGSDIIWDYSVNVFNNDPLLFGKGFNASEINAYAASFGTVSVDAVFPAYVVSAIKNMKFISVRDDKSAELVKRVTGIKPQVVLDPTWLWDFEKDCKIVKPDEIDYILVYGQDFTTKFINNLIKYAKDYKKKIIALDCNNDHYEWCDKMISQVELSPFQWIGYFKYATQVATSTFHGITLSLIFNKNFAFCKTDFVMAKVDKFLQELNLFELFDKDQNDVYGMLNHDFHYSFINDIIKHKREESINFLRKACNITNGTE